MAHRILVLPGGLRHENIGDLVMLQVAVRRLLALDPSMEIRILTDDAAGLALYCPGATPVDGRHWRNWLSRPLVPHRIRTVLPSRLRSLVRKAERYGASRWPGEYESALHWMKRWSRHGAETPSGWEAAWKDADALVISGMGGFTSEFSENALAMLRAAAAAKREGKRAVLFGQGIGPVDPGSILWRACRTVFPQVDLIALREGLHGPRLLREWGVAEDRIRVTGDDALEAIRRAGCGEGRPAGHHVGINLRVAKHSALAAADAGRIAAAIAGLLRERGLTPVSVPIARYAGATDGGVVQEAFARAGLAVRPMEWGPEAVIEQIGRLRAMITVSYHAGVFALGQGVPVIGLAPNEYYRYKLEGLRHQFGGWCEVLDPRTDEFGARLGGALDACLSMPPEEAMRLRQCANEQVAAGRQVYEEFRKLLIGRHAQLEPVVAAD